VFTDPAARHALEARIHPLVRAERERLFEQAQKEGARVAVAEASQLFESRTEGEYDRVLLVVAPEADRLRRWEEKGGDPEDARQRMAAQIPPESARQKARDVLVNDGSRDELRRKVAAVYQSWTAA